MLIFYTQKEAQGETPEVAQSLAIEQALEELSIQDRYITDDQKQVLAWLDEAQAGGAEKSGEGQNHFLFLDFDVGEKIVKKFNASLVKRPHLTRIIFAGQESLKALRKHQKGKDAAHGYIPKPLTSQVLLKVFQDFQLADFISQNKLFGESTELPPLPENDAASVLTRSNITLKETVFGKKVLAGLSRIQERDYAKAGERHYDSPFNEKIQKLFDMIFGEEAGLTPWTSKNLNGHKNGDRTQEADDSEDGEIKLPSEEELQFPQVEHSAVSSGPPPLPASHGDEEKQGPGENEKLSLTNHSIQFSLDDIKKEVAEDDGAVGELKLDTADDGGAAQLDESASSEESGDELELPSGEIELSLDGQSDSDIELEADGESGGEIELGLDSESNSDIELEGDGEVDSEVELEGEPEASGEIELAASAEECGGIELAPEGEGKDAPKIEFGVTRKIELEEEFQKDANGGPEQSAVESIEGGAEDGAAFDLDAGGKDETETMLMQEGVGETPLADVSAPEKDIPPSFHQGEALRFQATIRQLREERDKLLAELREKETGARLTEQENLSLRSELDENKIEISLLKKRYQEEIDEWKYRQRLGDEKRLMAEEKSSKLQKEFDHLQQKIRIDLEQVRKREKTLESQLELVQMDSDVQLKTRNQKILDLKRKVDQLEFSMENAWIKEQKSRDDKVRLQEGLERVVKTLRTSMESLEDNLGPEVKERLHHLK